MKISFFHSAVIAIASASLFSSCASLQKGEFAQRKYYDFPRSKHSIKGKETEYVSANIQNKITQQNMVAHKEKQVSEPIASVSPSRKENIFTIPDATISVDENDKTSTTVQKNVSDEIPVVSYKKPGIMKFIGKTPLHSPFSDPATTLLIMVLSAIFIPPLGVYIKERPRLSNWFWITLVMCILSVGILGWFGYSAGAGLWLVAAIIALLAVFDII